MFVAEPPPLTLKSSKTNCSKEYHHIGRRFGEMEEMENYPPEEVWV